MEEKDFEFRKIAEETEYWGDRPIEHCICISTQKPVGTVYYCDSSLYVGYISSEKKETFGSLAAARNFIIQEVTQNVLL
jgi:hypothetical protein